MVSIESHSISHQLKLFFLRPVKCKMLVIFLLLLHVLLFSFENMFGNFTYTVLFPCISYIYFNYLSVQIQEKTQAGFYLKITRTISRCIY